MKWSPDIIEKVLSAHDIVDFIGRDTLLKSSSSGQMTGLCPFPDHQEKTPSFSVSQVKQVYHCFGCGRGGNLFTYLRSHRGMSFPSAMEYLASSAGIRLDSPVKDSSFSKRQEAFKINAKVCDFYHENLLKLGSDHLVFRYLKKRGFDKNRIEKFKLGFAPLKGGLLPLFNDSEKKLMSELGLLIPKKEGGFYEMFRYRLMFPILSTMDKVLGFGARALDDTLPKYINSRDSISFHKGRTFYGLNESAGPIRAQGYALIVEGYTDFLALFQSGFQNTAATLGTALTSHHARILRRYTDKVVLFFDGDEAGSRAALRSLPLLLAEGFRVRYSALKGMDPDECLKKKGPAYLKEIISKNKDLFLHLFSTKLKSSQGADRLDMVSEMAGWLFSVKDRALREYYKRSLLDVFSPAEQKSAEAALERERQKHLKAQKRSENRSEPFSSDEKLSDSKTAADQMSPAKISLKKASQPEIYLLALILKDEGYLKYVMSNLNLEHIENTQVRKILSSLFEKYKKNAAQFQKLQAQTALRVEPEPWLQVEHHSALKSLSLEQGQIFIDDCLRRMRVHYENIRLKTQAMQLKLDGSKREGLSLIQDIKKHIIKMEKKHEIQK